MSNTETEQQTSQAVADRHPHLKKFIVERNGKSFVLYAGLLDLAHGDGLKAVNTTLVQIPSDLNGQMAIVHATVETGKGTFTGLGDAAPDNVARMMVPHLIRMAETRAKARALRDAVNVGVTALEELGEMGGDDRDDGSHPDSFGRASFSGGRSGSSNGSGSSTGSRPAPRPQQRSFRDDGSQSGFEGDRGYSQAAPSGGDGGGRPGAAPATPKQLQTIQRMARAAGKNYPTENLTRAQASEIISNLIGDMDGRSGE